MERTRAFVPWTFFNDLLPFNAELIGGNAMVVRACGAKPDDGSILHSKEYLLFGNGMGTLLPQATALAQKGITGYVMEFVQKKDKRRVTYWEVQSVPEQTMDIPWHLKVSSREPDPDDDGHIKMLASQEGNPSQFLFLSYQP